MAAGRRSHKKKKKNSIWTWLAGTTTKRRYRKKHFSLTGWLFKWSFKWGMIAGIWAAVIGGMIVTYYAMDLPDLSKLFEVSRTPSITILDRDNTVIGQFGQLADKNVAYEDIPQFFVDAVTATEDRRFFEHWGIDVIGLLRAAYVNSRAGHIVQGGSTITQQLVKVVLLKPERTFKRKIQEVMLSFYLEKHFTKKQIFTMYANRVYLGAGNYGIASASRFYFDKHAKDLNLYESAMLAGLIQAPSRYSPTNNPELTERRTSQVLANMYDKGKLASPQPMTKKTGLDFRGIQEKKKPQYPYFSRWIREQLPDYIGSTQEDIVVKTTFDNHLQDMAEKALIGILTKEGKARQATQGAMVVLSPEGEVLAMVGGVDASASEFNRATQAMRQPGSSFKLFVYLAALEYGLTPQDMTVDAPISIGKWRPVNYHRRYAGQVPLDYAFAHSINTVAIRLAQKVGIGRVVSVANRLGITTPITTDLSSALGTSEVNLLELTSAYAHLANGGNAVWTHAINAVVTSKGQMLYQRTAPVVQTVLTPEVVGNMNQMLMKVVESGTGKAAQMDRPSAGKTGTSQDARDAWFVGFTADYVAGVWVGNDNNSPMKNVVGGGLPAQIWKACMVPAHASKPIRPIPAFFRDGQSPAPGGATTDQDGIMSLWEGMFQASPASPEAAPPSVPIPNNDNPDTSWENLQNNLLGDEGEVKEEDLPPQPDASGSTTNQEAEPEVIWSIPDEGRE